MEEGKSPHVGRGVALLPPKIIEAERPASNFLI